MIQLVPQLKVLVACEPVDFRKGIDSLACVCRQQFQLDPFLGTLFVFRNRSGTALKLLVYDGQGVRCQIARPLVTLPLHKRLEQHRPHPVGFLPVIEPPLALPTTARDSRGL